MAKIGESTESMKQFIDDLYALNPDVLPPKEMVTNITIDFCAGSPARTVVTVVGLNMPTLNAD